MSLAWADVTFRVDDFSYKKLFHPISYAKVMPILRNSRQILQIKSKFIFVYFPTTRPHITCETYFILFLLTFPSFSFVFSKTEKAVQGGGLKMGPLVPVRAMNRY